MSQPWQQVLDFWFLPPGHPQYLRARVEWFEKNPGFDRDIRENFGELVEEAVAGGLTSWHAEPRGALARLLLLDQFTRNIWRDTARAFAGDKQAVTLALQLIAQGSDQALEAIERQFVYLPLMHAEDLALQEQCVALYRSLAQQHPSLAGSLDFAIRHRDIIERFGRFPHRNRQLERQSSAEEAEFLTQPGSGF